MLYTRRQSVDMLLWIGKLHSRQSLIADTDIRSRYGNALVTFDQALERKLRLKIDLFVIPTVSVLYLFCFIDRANIDG